MLKEAKNIHSVFIESCKKNLDRPAIFINGAQYSYRDFSSIISSIRRQIKSSPVKTKRIGIYSNEHVNSYASIWAVMSTGAAYIPINNKHPFERAASMLQDAQVEILLYAEETETLKLLKEHFNSTILFIKTNCVLDGELDFSSDTILEDDLVYILFTSGSTGKPKGVPVMHKNLLALAKNQLHEKYLITNEDRFLQMFELTFDYAVLPTIFPFCAGASIYAVPQEGIMYLNVLKVLEDHKITLAWMVPSVINYLQPYFDQISLPFIKWSVLSGEALHKKAADGWAKCCPNGIMINIYGPTEATVFITEYFMNMNNYDSVNGVVSIGQALDNMTCFIVDEDLKEVENGVKGELCVYGPQVSQGYLNDEERTRKSFIHIDRNGYRGPAYRTGDLCYINEKGNIMYCGRIDHQIKINGFRVELGEIEFHAKRFCKERNLAAFTITNQTGGTSIYMTIENFNIEQEKEALVDYMKKALPIYMIPDKIFSTENLPLSLNGKTDRNKLREIYATN